LRKWYEFKEFHRIIYNHYFESIYRMDAIELSYFKLVTFLEGYHRELWELNHPSPIRSLKHTYFNSIMRMLEEIEIDNTDKKVVNTILKQNKELTLAQRLKEIFEYYSDIVSISGPVVSFFDNARLNKLIQEIVMDKVISYKLTEIINLKNEADSEIIQEIRKQKYQRILEFLNSESPNVGHSLLLFVKFVLMEQFPKEFAKYRNTMAHLLARDYQRIGINRWFYGLKILQLTAQLCVLSLLGFTHKEICAIFFLDSIDDRIKLEVMIKSNIDLETYVT
jgi:hypothetical protein